MYINAIHRKNSSSLVGLPPAPAPHYSATIAWSWGSQNNWLRLCQWERRGERKMDLMNSVTTVIYGGSQSRPKPYQMSSYYVPRPDLQLLPNLALKNQRINSSATGLGEYSQQQQLPHGVSQTAITNYGSYKRLQCTFNVNKIIIPPTHLLSPYDIFSTITIRNYMHCFWQISKTKHACFF